MKVLLVGHACSPRRGSDPAVTWNWAWHLSKRHQVWVLTHPQEREAIEQYLAENPNPSLRYVFVSLPRWLDSWNHSDPKSRVGARHYIIWQEAALRQARKLHRQVSFDLAHHVSWGTVLIPPPFHRLGIPFVWGPLGGGQVPPPAFRNYFGKSWRKEVLRSLMVRLSSFLPTFRTAARRSALALPTNRETAALLKNVGARNVVTFLDSGIRGDFISPAPPQSRPAGELTLLWVGKFETRKCLPLALEAMARVRDLPSRLLVAGTGSLRQPWEALAHRLGIGERVTFLGQVAYPQMPTLYRSAHALLFTSLRDSFGSQVLEAMGSGLPVITLDHQGVGATVPPQASVKIPVTTPKETIGALADSIRRVANSPELRRRMGLAAWEFAQTQTWERRAEIMSQLYSKALNGSSPSASCRAFPQ